MSKGFVAGLLRFSSEFLRFSGDFLGFSNDFLRFSNDFLRFSGRISKDFNEILVPMLSNRLYFNGYCSRFLLSGGLSTRGFLFGGLPKIAVLT